MCHKLNHRLLFYMTITRQPRWLSGLTRSCVHSLWLLVDHCVLSNWDRILVRAVKGLISRAGMVSICPLLWQRDVKLQQTQQTQHDHNSAMCSHLGIFPLVVNYNTKSEELVNTRYMYVLTVTLTRTLTSKTPTITRKHPQGHSTRKHPQELENTHKDSQLENTHKNSKTPTRTINSKTTTRTLNSKTPTRTRKHAQRILTHLNSKTTTRTLSSKYLQDLLTQKHSHLLSLLSLNY